MKPKRHEKKTFRPHHHALDDGEAFVADIGRTRGRLAPDAEDFAEEFVATATSGEDAFEDARDELVWEELGGPFLEIEARDVAPALFGAEPER